MATKTWIGTDGNYAANANWSPTNVPTSGDHVRIPAGSGSITSGLNQSAVDIGDFIVEPGYTGTIGTASAYLQIDPDRFEYSGNSNSASYIDIGSAAIPLQVYKTGPAAEGYRALYLKGSGITVLNVASGSVGIAARSGETSTVTTLRTISSSASVSVGAGCSLTNHQQLDGNVELHCAATTVSVYDGTLRTVEVGAITTLNVRGGEVFPESTGTITTLNAYAGSTDFTGSGAARTVTTLNLKLGGKVAYDPAVLTITNAIGIEALPVVLMATAA